MVYIPPAKEKYYQITFLEKGVKDFELLAGQKALTVSEVAVRLDINRAGAHRFLTSLRDLGYVEKNEGNRYQLTFRMLEMGIKVADRFEIRQEARKFMEELAKTIVGILIQSLNFTQLKLDGFANSRKLKRLKT